MPGHVFVFRGDLTRLACDAVLLSCDEAFNITTTWKDLLPADLARGDAPDWWRLPVEGRDGTVVWLPAMPDGRRVLATATVPSDTRPSPDWVAERVVHGLELLAPDLRAAGGRALPLVALALPGTGAGGLGDRRGEVIDALLPRLRHSALRLGLDVGLVLWDARDMAAVLHRRTDDDWSELSPALLSRASTLGELAGQGRLSLFIGAGTSMPVGLPSWFQLLRGLAQDAGILDPAWTAIEDPLVAAEAVVDHLGDRFHSAVAERVHTTKHAIGHALLANLGVRQMVTTNYDVCMELALDPLKQDYRVLTRHLASSDLPWLLKLHGDVERAGSIVLSERQYSRHSEEYEAVRGVVQSLMLTSHLLFVGFSFTDASFLNMARAVGRVRQDAAGEVSASDLPKAGTGLALAGISANAAELSAELDFIPMVEEAEAGAPDEREVVEQRGARLLEVFLDRMLWSAARAHDLSAVYLLDARYSSGLTDSDRALRDGIAAFLAQVPDAARASAGWPRIERAMSDLGRTPD